MNLCTALEVTREYESLAWELSGIKDPVYKGLKDIPLGPHTEYWARFLDKCRDEEFCIHLFTVTC